MSGEATGRQPSPPTSAELIERLKSQAANESSAGEEGNSPTASRNELPPEALETALASIADMLTERLERRLEEVLASSLDRVTYSASVGATAKVQDLLAKGIEPLIQSLDEATSVWTDVSKRAAVTQPRLDRWLAQSEQDTRKWLEASAAKLESMTLGYTRMASEYARIDDLIKGCEEMVCAMTTASNELARGHQITLTLARESAEEARHAAKEAVLVANTAVEMIEWAGEMGKLTAEAARCNRRQADRLWTLGNWLLAAPVTLIVLVLWRTSGRERGFHSWSYVRVPMQEVNLQPEQGEGQTSPQ